MPIFDVEHVTTYGYKRPVAFGPHRMMLRPQEGHDQRLHEFALTVSPRPASIRWSYDVLDNRVGLATFHERAAELRFECRFRLEQASSHPEGFGIADAALSFPFDFPAGDAPDLEGYIARRYADEENAVDDFARGFLPPDGPTPTLDLLARMTRAIREDFAYNRRVEKGIQPPTETLRLAAGTCRDFAVLMMEGVRALGLPARFVSGYLYVPARDTHDLHGGGSTHAWLQVYLPGAGWIDFDPTNAGVGNHGLIRVAVAREPSQALPLFGSFVGLASDDLGMTVTVKVTCVDREEWDKRAGAGEEVA